MSLAAIQEDLGLSTRVVASKVGCSPAAVYAVINRKSGRAGLRISRKTRGKIIGTIVGAKRHASATKPAVQLTDMTRCQDCGETYHEHNDGRITCACGEHYPANSRTDATPSAGAATNLAALLAAATRLELTRT